MKKKYPKQQEQELLNEPVSGYTISNQFTSEELNEQAAKAIEDYKNGKYISHEEIKKIFLV